MTPTAKGFILRLFGMLLSVIPPAVATLFYFPLWQERGAAYLVSGTAVLLLAVSAIPLLRYVRDKLRSPSAYLIWLALFILFALLSRIADEMCVISFVGFIGNTLGAICFGAAKKAGKSA